MFENFLRRLFGLFRRHSHQPPRRAPAPAPVPPPVTAPAPMVRTDEMIERWAREEMAKVTSREMTPHELTIGVAHYKTEPYASRSEQDVRDDMYRAAKQHAEFNDWPPPNGASTNTSQTPPF
jgi:hypothetical protein